MTTFLDLARARKGHFLMESGLHCGLWFDLDIAFVDPKALEPLVAQLAQSLTQHEIEAVCGPLTGGAFLAQSIASRLGCEFYFTAPATSPTGETARVRYVLPPATGHRLLGKRVAVVDDVMSAGSSLRATLRELEQHGAIPVVVGALHVLGSVGASFFTERGLRIETLGRGAFDAWRPSECPLCAASVPLDDRQEPQS